MKDTKRDFWAQTFAEYRIALNRYFRRRGSQAHDAEDLAQEVYLRLLRSDQNGTRQIESPEAYLFTVAANLLREKGAAARRMGLSLDIADIDETLLPTSMTPEDELEITLRERKLAEAVASLPAKYQRIVVLHYLENKTYQEMAGDFGVTPHAIKKYVSQALRLCRRKLRQLEQP
ncbi:MAG TPA: sigma-70 family RNA polymerase sigma factor [Rhizomicrobium sp.]|nr:sigma-70 family RNA polymerase sigma factor [Rhizomicrobium sp.]